MCVSYKQIYYIILPYITIITIHTPEKKTSSCPTLRLSHPIPEIHQTGMQEVNFEPLQQVQHLIRSLERIKEHGDEHPKHGDSTREKHSGIRFFGGLLIQHPRA